MKTCVLYLMVLSLVLSISGCSTSRVAQPVNKPNETLVVPTLEIHGFKILPEKWMNNDPEIIRKNISEIIDKLTAANFNSLFFLVNRSSEKYLHQIVNAGTRDLIKDTSDKVDPLNLACETAHRNNMKIYCLLDLSVPSEKEFTIPMPQFLTSMKSKIRDLVSGYDIDGLCILAGENSPELIEYMVVEIMMIKPYLVSSLAYSDAGSYQNALKSLQEGVADFIVKDSDLATDPDKINGLFQAKTNIPENIKRLTPEQAVSFDLSDIFPGNPGGQTILINHKSKTRITDSNGVIGFINNAKDTIDLETGSGKYKLPTESWSVPFKYSLLRDGKVVRKAPWVEFREMPARTGSRPESDLLCKTDYPALFTRINIDTLKQYKTGIFFDRLKFHEGPNRIRATVTTSDSSSVFYENEFIYHKTDRTRKTYPLWINERTIEPAEDLELLPEDIVRLSFQGSKGQEGYAEITPGKLRIDCLREDFEDYSIYKGEILLRRLKPGRIYKIVLKLKPAAGAPDSKTYELTTKHILGVRYLSDFPLVKISRENSRLTYDLGAPRLGGPIRAELGSGVILKTNGKSGENFRIKLSNVENGYIGKSDVQVMPAGTVQPGYYIESMSCGPSKDGDVLSIPYPEPVPYEIYPDPDQKRIVITLFGVETSSTWITHLAERKIIDKVTWQQVTPETYRIYVNLNTANIWGYSINPERKRLVLRVRYAPVFDINNLKPLTGLKIAIEAGHGGSNYGAVGLSGLLEKDVNLDLSLRLGELCQSMGAEIVQVRDSDKDMSLFEKRNIARNSGANILVCIHANAGGGGGGYLSTAGTSTYYNNPFWAQLAEKVYDKMLELKLKEFGVVGSFNYTVIRNTQMPSILVEQAFMDNAEDEEKLADPIFRQQEAQKIYEGIIDFLKMMKN